MRPSDLWRSLFRIAVGLYWLFFASQKWAGVAWMEPLIKDSARSNPVPGLHEFLVQVVAPHWYFFAVTQAVAETAVAVLLILGLASRLAAIGSFVLALSLSLTIAFLVPDLGTRWLYYLALIVSAELMVADPGSIALRRARFIPAWLR